MPYQDHLKLYFIDIKTILRFRSTYHVFITQERQRHHLVKKELRIDLHLQWVLLVIQL